MDRVLQRILPSKVNLQEHHLDGSQECVNRWLQSCTHRLSISPVADRDVLAEKAAERVFFLV